MSIVLGVISMALVIWLSYSIGSESRRVHELATVSTGAHSFETATKASSSKTNKKALLYRLGRGITQFLVNKVPGLKNATFGEREFVVVGAGCLSALPVTLILNPGFALVLPVASLAIGLVAPVFRARAHREEIARQLPTVLDLFRLAIGAGMNVTLALQTVSMRLANPCGAVFQSCLAQIQSGVRVSAALSQLVETHGEEFRPLVDALLSAERHGAPVSQSLERLSIESRLQQAERSERIARKLSVQLLLPLSGCVLPAFALLTVVPLLAGSFSTLASTLS